MPIIPDFLHLGNVTYHPKRIECCEREGRGLFDLCHRGAFIRSLFHHADSVVEDRPARRSDAGIAAACAGPEAVERDAATQSVLQEDLVAARAYPRPLTRERSFRPLNLR
jgi:hypothetical protein